MKNPFKCRFTPQKVLDRSKICLFRGGRFWTRSGFSKKGKKWSKNDVLAFFDMTKKSKNGPFWIFWSWPKIPFLDFWMGPKIQKMGFWPFFGFWIRSKIQKRVVFGFWMVPQTIQNPKIGSWDGSHDPKNDPQDHFLIKNWSETNFLSKIYSYFSIF